MLRVTHRMQKHTEVMDQNSSDEMPALADGDDLLESITTMYTLLINIYKFTFRSRLEISEL